MDANEPQEVVRPRRKRGIALLASALVLCTAGGALGGLAIGDALHSGASNREAMAANPYAGFSFRGWNGQSMPSLSGPFGLPNMQQPAGTETTPASAKQLLGLVRIQTTLGYEHGAAVGTGMLLTSDGEVVTNHHVIEGATAIVVTVMSTGQQYRATLVGSDATDDIAVLRIDGVHGLRTIQPDTTTVKAGQSVVAVGDAGGATTFTASPGHVTGTDQTITPADDSRSQPETLRGVIAYAAYVVPGDSGGATYDSAGGVIGMTTAASAGGSETNGYAIGISRVLSIASDLESHVAKSKYVYGLPSFMGVAVSQSNVVEQIYAGTGAARSGLAVGDHITAVDGHAVSTASQLQSATRAHPAGSTITLTWTTPAGQPAGGRLRLISGPAA